MADLSRTTLPSNTVVWLDLLRGMSAQAVLLGHLRLFDSATTPLQHAAAPQTIAVIVFYILSGFLIFHTIANKIHISSYNFTSFFIDRFCRIYPAYFASLVFVVIVDALYRSFYPADYLEHGYRYRVSTFIANVFFLQKINIHQGSFGTATQLWSLPPEWWLYMLTGYVMFTLRIKKTITFKNILITALFGFAPVCFLFKGNPITGVGMSAIWLFGGIVYVMYKHLPVNTTEQNMFRMMTCFSLIFLGCAIQRYISSDYGYDILGAFNLSGAFLCTVWLTHSHRCDFLTHPYTIRASKFFAGYSFSLYLTHHSLVLLLAHSWPTMAIWIFCNLVAIGFAYIFERNHREIAARMRTYFKIEVKA